MRIQDLVKGLQVLRPKVADVAKRSCTSKVSILWLGSRACLRALEAFGFLMLKHFYWPQGSCGQGNIFAPVCHSVHRGVSASVHTGIPHPPRADTPSSEQTPLDQTPSGSRHLLEQTHTPEQTPPGSRPSRSRHPQSRHTHTHTHTHSPEADTSPGKQTPAYGQ